jgi:hypothetical protein
MRCLVWPSVSCRLYNSIIVVCCDGRYTVTKGFRCVQSGDSVVFEPLHSSRCAPRTQVNALFPNLLFSQCSFQCEKLQLIASRPKA